MEHGKSFTSVMGAGLCLTETTVSVYMLSWLGFQTFAICEQFLQVMAS